VVPRSANGVKIAVDVQIGTKDNLSRARLIICQVIKAFGTG
jgi:hypothetical protein